LSELYVSVTTPITGMVLVNVIALINAKFRAFSESESPRASASCLAAMPNTNVGEEAA
jgi:hypothetical protein